MAVNVRPLSSANPKLIEDSEYQRLVERKESGWSRCRDETEWLAKLHYLRDGVKAGKLSAQDFLKRESMLVEAWLKTLV